MDKGEGMIKKVNFTIDLRDVIDSEVRKNKIIEPMDAISDELLDKLVDDMISNHIKDFISARSCPYSCLIFDITSDIRRLS